MSRALIKGDVLGEAFPNTEGSSTPFPGTLTARIATFTILRSPAPRDASCRLFPDRIELSYSLSEGHRQGGLIGASIGHAQSQFDQLVIARVNPVAVQHLKRFSAGQRNAFIAIHEGVILIQVKQVGRRHGREIFVEIPPAVPCGGHRHGGFQQSTIPDFSAPAMESNHGGMNQQDLVDRQKPNGFHHSASRFNTESRRANTSASASSKRRLSVAV
jgi:hypothetical protein